MKKIRNLISLNAVLVVQGLVLTTSQAVLATPVSANWTYKISIIKGAPTPDIASKAIAAAGMLFGSVTVANGADAGTINVKGFNLNSHVKVAALLSMLDSNLNMFRKSNGIFVNGIAFTQRYSDKRGSNPEMLMAANPKQKQFTFTNGAGPARMEPIKYAMVDIAMLPYAFVGRPAPKAVSFIAFTDGKSIYSTTLTPVLEKLEVAGKVISAVHLSGFASGGSLDLWIREADGYPLHMRVGLSAQYGAVLDQRIESVPASLFTL